MASAFKIAVLQAFPWVSLYIVVFGLSDVVWAYRRF
jgi:hypothetical protein